MLIVLLVADIDFTMPLKNRESKSPVTNDTSDTGYNSLDVDEDQFGSDQHDEEPDEWLHSMGVGEGIIRKINTSQVKILSFLRFPKAGNW